jgi:hypothetical protein
MTEYKVKSTDTRKFSLTQNDIILGDLTYEKWFSFTSEIILADNSRYQIEPKGFWGTTIEVRDEKNILLDFKMNWNGNIIINTKFDNVENHFVFKPKGIFKSTYALFDTEGQEILVIQPDFKWSKFNYDYDVNNNSSRVRIRKTKITTNPIADQKLTYNIEYQHNMHIVIKYMIL